MGRGTAHTTRIRQILRGFDRFGIVSPQGNPLTNLLSIEWSGLFARAVLTASPRAHPSVCPLIGLRTVSAAQLVQAYEPLLLDTVLRLLHEEPRCKQQLLSNVSTGNGPLHYCALFGWAQVCAALLEHGASPSSHGEHGMTPLTCARTHGWQNVVDQLLHKTTRQEQCRRPASTPNVPHDMSIAATHENDTDTLEFLCPLATDNISSRKEWVSLSLPHVVVPQPQLVLDEVDGVALPVEVFLRDFFYRKRPVLIRGGAGKVPALQWTPELLLEELSQNSSENSHEASAVTLCSIPYPDEWMPPAMAAEAKHIGSVSDIVKGHTGYLFVEVEEESVLGQLLARDVNLQAVLPSLFREENQILLPQFSLGQSGSGAPWHWHQDAFNICLAGQRAWYLRPPASALMSRQPVSESIPEANTSFFAVQSPGDIMYIPELWSHCVVNCKLSAAVSVEFGTS